MVFNIRALRAIRRETQNLTKKIEKLSERPFSSEEADSVINLIDQTLFKINNFVVSQGKITPEMRTNLDSLKLFLKVVQPVSGKTKALGIFARINELEIKNSSLIVKIEPGAPLPKLSKGINHSIAARWIDAHPPEYRRALEASIQVIKHISYEEFEREFARSINSFNAKMREEESFEYIALSWQNKSNEWMLKLALPLLNKLPFDVIDFQNIFKQVDILQKKYSSFPEKLKIVIFDDGIYSGKQLHEIISLLSRTFKVKGLKIGLDYFVVCPFMTTAGIKNIISKLPHGINVFFSLYREIPGFIQSIIDKFPKEAKEMIKIFKSIAYEKTDPRLLEGLGTCFFDHKVPDKLSFPIFLSTGNVTGTNGEILLEGETFPFIPTIIPPYKQLK